MRNFIEICFVSSSDISKHSGNARITIGSWSEIIRPSLSVWSIDDYDAHWSRSLDELRRGAKFIVICVSYESPYSDCFLCKREGEIINIMNSRIKTKKINIGNDLLKVVDIDWDSENWNDDSLSHWYVHVPDFPL